MLAPQNLPETLVLALHLVIDERLKQMAKGYDVDHDSEYDPEQLPQGAMAMIQRALGEADVLRFQEYQQLALKTWPWSDQNALNGEGPEAAWLCKAVAMLLARMEVILAGDAEMTRFLDEVVRVYWSPDVKAWYAARRSDSVQAPPARPIYPSRFTDAPFGNITLFICSHCRHVCPAQRVGPHNGCGIRGSEAMLIEVNQLSRSLMEKTTFSDGVSFRRELDRREMENQIFPSLFALKPPSLGPR